MVVFFVKENNNNNSFLSKLLTYATSTCLFNMRYALSFVILR